MKNKRLNLNLRRKKKCLPDRSNEEEKRGSFSSGFRERERERVWREREGTCFGERELNGQQKPF